MFPARLFLVFCALVWLPYGLYCLVQPGFLEEAAGVAFHTPTGATELRAMYGGLQAAIGALAAGAAWRTAWVRPTLTVLVFLCAGLGLGRLAGVALDGGLSAYTGFALGFEFGSVGAALWCLGRTARPVGA